MKPLNLNKKSWHYKLATGVSNMHKKETSTDLCEYTRYVLKGLIGLVFFGSIMLFLGGATLFMVAVTIAYWVAAAVLLTFPPDGAGPILMTIAIIFALSAWKFGPKISSYFSNRRDRLRDAPLKPDTFLRNAYKSWKEKTCVRIILSDPDTDSYNNNTKN